MSSNSAQELLSLLKSNAAISQTATVQRAREGVGELRGKQKVFHVFESLAKSQIPYPYSPINENYSERDRVQFL